ncbi:cilia- and flagella-associated protein 97 [Hyla sarda]|uniref:cilia- and flagella-associated protein 97 n=1 Tax=Hyla sarda TaxID=327740 RepID=UPI0024C2D039|nr:cilia- and flagella-associated protein 97 [Hyla sarda]XP_056415924.1 cilia- and flagella-associated protein 97 [Hyla sarda]XP_056415933.1 cilia- and flagella-associated protein 97 [Hyla sarda]XP_056415941.1 cilia- and flagella-associated protein 97 [Hyla sarda]XP_056415948.1 cilia- and flagella-associated protein 97 [Hyla sarda]
MDRYGNLSDEGEVDHSFFDSGDEETKQPGVSTSGPSTYGHKQNKEDSDSGDSERADEPQQGPSSNKTQELSKETKPKIPEPVMSVDAPRPSSAVKSGRSSAASLRIEATIPTGIPQIRRDFEDNYYPDEDDSSEEENRSSRPRPAKQTNIGKKSSGKYSRDFPSSISSSDTDFSDATSDDHTSKSYQSSKDRAPSNVRSPERRLCRPSVRDLRDYVDESEDTVTDVTPLSTPDISPIQSFDIAATSEALKAKVKRQENIRQESYEPEIDGKPNPKALQDAMDLNQLLKAFMHLDKKDQERFSLDHPSVGLKKNYSFTSEEVRQIDRENQRLLKELSRHATKTKGKSLTPKKLNTTPTRLYHSTLNRQKEQQRIERENMALLKRLESVKPTVGMTRSEQMMDYQRQAGYLSSTATSPRPGKASVSRLSHASSGGVSRVSSASSRSSRMGSSAALLRPTKPSNVRAAWM